MPRDFTPIVLTAGRYQKIVLGGHDWGGAVVYRTCLWYPEFVTHLFSVCTPYFTPVKADYVDLETRVNTILPNFRYQIPLASGEVEKKIQGRDALLNFLNGMYGGRGPEGEVVFTTEEGPIFENVSKIGQSPLLEPHVGVVRTMLKTDLTETQESEYYADEYARKGLHSTLNWYRTGPINHKEELE